MKRIIFTLCSAALISFVAQAKIELPSVFGDNMVLQQQTDAAVWGKAKAGAKVTIAPSWTKTKTVVTAGDDGKWSTRIATPAAGGPYSITFSDGEKTVIDNVLIGEVWYCSGQSNMEMPIKGWAGQGVEGSIDAVVSANPDTPVRIFHVKRRPAFSPMEDVIGKWALNTPETVAETSATAYFFAVKLQQSLRIPIGIVVSEWGGTPIRTWMNEETVRQFKGEVDVKHLDARKSDDKHPSHLASTLYNGQVHGLVPFTFKGQIWYQGCSDRHEPELYSRLQPAYVKMWREIFQIPDAPFYFVQIAPFIYSDVNGCDRAFQNEAQAKTLDLVPNTGMVTTLDCGEKDTIHPRYKKTVGNRLAYLALQQTYGIKGFDAVAPRYKGMEIKGDKIEITFTTRYLMPMRVLLNGFEIAGADRQFHPATAIYNQKIGAAIVSSPDVPAPVAVRYGWRNWVKTDFTNLGGVPVAPFRTDDWEYEPATK